MTRRKLARWASTFAAAALSLSATTSAPAGTVTLQNDSGAGQVLVAGFDAGEAVGAWLTSPCAGEITAVQIGWGSVLGGTGQTFHQEIRIYRAGAFPSPGVQITNGELLGPVLTDGFINEFPTVGLGFTVSAGETIVVVLEFASAIGALDAGPVHDGDGCQTPFNTVFCTGGQCVGWNNACTEGVTGDWVIRAVVDCTGAVTGACCLADGSCIDDEEDGDCTAAGGTFQGIDTTCAGVTCPEPMGACCVDADCFEDLTLNDCVTTPGGVFLGGGTTCAGVSCEGACCFAGSPGSCSVQTEDTCVNVLGGVFAGAGTDCTSVQCAGACCLPDGSCMDVAVEGDCDAMGGVFQGDGNDCASITCPAPQGACCLANGGCLENETEANCLGIPGATWAGPQTTCVPDCTPLGACCLSGGGCLADQTELNCVGIPGATWAGEGTTCPDGCATPCPYDCGNPTDGTVSTVDLLALLSQWGGSGSCDNGADGSTPNGTVDTVDLLALLAAWGACE